MTSPSLIIVDAANVVGKAGFTWHIGTAPTVADPGAQNGFTGAAVSIAVTGAFEFQRVTISPDAVDPLDAP